MLLLVYDVIPFRLKEGFSLLKYKNAKSYTDYKQLLENRDIDAVLVSTPLSTHSKISFDACRRQACLL